MVSVRNIVRLVVILTSFISKNLTYFTYLFYHDYIILVLMNNIGCICCLCVPAVASMLEEFQVFMRKGSDLEEIANFNMVS